jgi:hydrogenase maturation protein HypF
LVRDALGAEVASRLRFAGVTSQQVRQVLAILDRRHLSPVTTSAGRLFDGAAALILGIESSAFEGSAAMFLESACGGPETAAYSLPLQSSVPMELDWRPMIANIVSDCAAGALPGVMAQRFHASLAEGLASVCRHFAGLPVVLAGGVFQNRVLTERAIRLLEASGRAIGLPGRIPPGDGGLAAGQLAIAATWQAREGLIPT